MHRRKDLWGPDGEDVISFPLTPMLTHTLAAEEFDPDRFLDERLRKYLTPNPFIFSPFNAGPRICMGQQVGMLLLKLFCSNVLMPWQFAYNEMSYFLTRLLQAFSSISLAEDVQTLAPAEWAKAPGRKGVEKAIIKSHLTLYVQVSVANMIASMHTSDLVSRMASGLGWNSPVETRTPDHVISDASRIIRLAGLAVVMEHVCVRIHPMYYLELEPVWIFIDISLGAHPKPGGSTGYLDFVVINCLRNYYGCFRLARNNCDLFHIVSTIHDHDDEQQGCRRPWCA